MNNIYLIGRFTKEHDVQESKDKKTKILRNTIAVSRDKETTDFIPVTFLGKLAETVEKYTTKGNRISIVGALHITSYEDAKTKEKKSYTNVLVSNIDLIDFKDNNKDNKPTDDQLPF